MRVFASLFLYLVLAFSTAAYADEITPCQSVVTGVIIRAEPSTSSESLGLLRPDETLTFVADHPSGYEVRLADGRTGFVSKRWTRRIETPGEEPAAGPGPLTAASPAMFAHFVYVGQGAGAILEFPCGVAVIDTGGQYNGDTDGAALFNRYLDRFFAEHPQYSDTIDVLFTSHPHRDHLDGLAGLLEGGALRHQVLNVVDNGQSGTGDSVRKQMNFGVIVRASGGGSAGVMVTPDLIPHGITNARIDPLDCQAAGVDPVITIYWGGWARDTVRDLGGRGRYRSNANNHSLVIRVDFGEASFLFTGDLERPAIEDMLAIYPDDRVFDVDIYHVGHHGADNATTAPLLAAMTPEIAIISMGNLDDTSRASARGHGHPRAAALRLLQQANPGAVSGQRAPVTVQAFETEDELVDVVIERAIYATGWQGDIVLRADTTGAYAFTHAH
jgi:hypothetical protein